MKNIIAILLIVVGVLVLGYQGFTYTSRDKVAQIGSVEVSADTQKTVYFPPIVGGLCLVAGVVLMLVGRKNT